MTNKEVIEKLNKIGKLPSSAACDTKGFPLNEFTNLIEAFTIPIDFEAAVQLVNLSPPVDKGCYEVEWSLVHLVEEININELQSVLDNADDGEVKRIIQRRLVKYNDAKSNTHDKP